MSRPVERWLGTFMCKHYSDMFDAHGYKTLNSVCQLNYHQLQSMGVAPEHCEKIMENVSVLRQSYTGVNKQGSEGYSHKLDPVINPASSALVNISRSITCRGVVNPNQVPEKCGAENSGTEGGMSYGAQKERNPENAQYLQRAPPPSQMEMPRPREMSSYPMQPMMSMEPKHYPNQSTMYGQSTPQQQPPYQDYRCNQMNIPLPHPGYDRQQNWQAINNYDPQHSYKGQVSMSAQPQHNVDAYNPNNMHFPHGPDSASRKQPGYASGEHASRGPPPNGPMNGTPQEVADTILHLASANYTSNGPQSVQPPNSSFTGGYGSSQMSPNIMPNSHGSQPQSMQYPFQNAIGGHQPSMSPLQVRSPGSVHSGQCMSSASPARSGSMQSPLVNSAECNTSHNLANMVLPNPMMPQAMCSSNSANVSSVMPHNLQSPSAVGSHIMPSNQMSPSTYPFEYNVSSPQSGKVYMDLSSSKSRTAASTGYQQASFTPSFNQNKSPPANPLLSLQQLVMLPEGRVIDPKSVVNDSISSPKEAFRCDEDSYQLFRQACSDGQHCGTDAEDEEESKDFSYEDNCSVLSELLCDDSVKICKMPSRDSFVNSDQQMRRSLPEKLEGGSLNRKATTSATKKAKTTKRCKSSPKPRTKRTKSPSSDIKSTDKEQSGAKNKHFSGSFDCSKINYSAEPVLKKCCVKLKDISPLKYLKKSPSHSSTSSSPKPKLIFERDAISCPEDKEVDSSDSSPTVENKRTYGHPMESETTINCLPPQCPTRDDAHKTKECPTVGDSSVSVVSQKESEDMNDGVESTNVLIHGNQGNKDSHVDLEAEIYSVCANKQECDINYPSCKLEMEHSLNEISNSPQSNVSIKLEEVEMISLSNPVCDTLYPPPPAPEPDDENTSNTSSELEHSARSESPKKPVHDVVSEPDKLTSTNSGKDHHEVSCNEMQLSKNYEDGTQRSSAFETSTEEKIVSETVQNASIKSEILSQDSVLSGSAPLNGEKYSLNSPDIDSGINTCNGTSPATNSDSPTKASDKENPVAVGLRKGKRRKPPTIPMKYLDYSSDEEVPYPPKRLRKLGSRSPKLSCVENKKKSVTDLIVDQAFKQDIRRLGSIEHDLKLPKQKSSLDEMVNRLSQNAIEKQVLTVAPVHISDSLGKENSGDTLCNSNSYLNHTASKIIGKPSPTPSTNQANDSLCSDESLDNSPSSPSDVNHSNSHTNSASNNHNEDVTVYPIVDLTLSASPEIIEGQLYGGDCDTVGTAFNSAETPSTCSTSMKEEIQNNDSAIDGAQGNLSENASECMVVQISPGSSGKKRKGRPPGSKNSIPWGTRTGKCKKKVEQCFIDTPSDDEAIKGLKKSLKSLKQTSKGGKTKAEPEFSGPYLKLAGTNAAPTSCKVISLQNPDSDKQGKKSHSKFQSYVDPSSVSLAKMSSTSQWHCEFCGKHSNYKSLGDLFGPYFIEPSSPPVSSPQASTSKKSTPACKKKGRNSIEESPSKKTGRRSLSPSKKTDLGSPSNSGAPTDRTEVWIHEDCLVWTSGICALGGKLNGLEESIQVASQTVCSTCKSTGATLGCLQKGCSQKYHYPCALEKDCLFDEENFSLLCWKHKEKRLKAAATTKNSH